jgi:NADPH-dependent 2,4-dienoyl-CoA reductase/sulfur reductase-like enzyme
MIPASPMKAAWPGDPGNGDGATAPYRTRIAERDWDIMTVSTPITTPFTAESTAAEVVDGIDLTGRRAIVTGGASGIGIETARALAGAGADVTLAVRNAEAGERTAADITETTGNKQVLAARLDLADQASVAAFAAAWDRPAALRHRRGAGPAAPPEWRRRP